MKVDVLLGLQWGDEGKPNKTSSFMFLRFMLLSFFLPTLGPSTQNEET